MNNERRERESEVGISWDLLVRFPTRRLVAQQFELKNNPLFVIQKYKNTNTHTSLRKRVVKLRSSTPESCMKS